jgi:hypothetical protein
MQVPDGDDEDPEEWPVLDEHELLQMQAEAADDGLLLEEARQRFGRGDLQLDDYLQQLVRVRLASAGAAAHGIAPAPEAAHESARPTGGPAAVPLPAAPPRDAQPPRWQGGIAVLAGTALVTGLVALREPAAPRRHETVSSTTALVPAQPAPAPRVDPAPPPRPGPAAAPAPPVPPPSRPASAAARGRSPAARVPTIGFASAGRTVISESARYVLLKVAARGPLRAPVEISVRAVGGAAVVNEDFVPPQSPLTLSPRRPSADILVSILADDIPEHVEDFSVVLAVERGEARLGTKSALVVITDDD